MLSGCISSNNEITQTMIIDLLENAGQYPLGPGWTKAFDFLKSTNASTPDGEYPIDGDKIFARVMSYPTRNEAEAVLESHELYADIQMTIEGAEGIRWIPSTQLQVKDPYDADKDVTFYHHPSSLPARVDNLPGWFTFLLPQDAHMPQLTVGPSSQTVKKVVVKVALTELTLG